MDTVGLTPDTVNADTDCKTEKLTGKINRVLILKGFGFIEGDDKKDYFFHMVDVNKESIAFRHLTEGMKVSFIPAPAAQPGKCMQAKQVSIIG